MSQTKVITGKVRSSYANVFEAKAIEEGQKPKFSVSLLIDKNTKAGKATIKKIEDAVKAALEEGKAKFGGKIPPTWKNPLRDGDEERPDDENYEGMMFVNANSDRRPGLVDEDLNAIIDPEDFYSGCYGRASVNFYAFNVSGNKGIACGLNNLQKLEDGERLSGGASAEDDFGDDSDELM